MEPSKETSNVKPKQDQARTPGSVGASSIGSDAKGLASQVVDRAKGMAQEQVAPQQEKSAGQIAKLAKALHNASEEVSDTMAAPYIKRAASMLDRVSSSVGEANFRDAVNATERFARREPLVFLGGAFTLGLLAARFLKSSEHHDEDADQPLLSEHQDLAEDLGGGTRRL